MNKQIALTFDGKNYNVCINDEVIYTDKKREEAYRFFEKTVDNNKQVEVTTWEEIRDSIASIQSIAEQPLSALISHEAYQAVEYKDIKYFHQTDKLFYTANGEMFPLVGGHRLLLFIVEIIAKKQLENSDSLVELCVEAMRKGINYRIKESTFTLASPIFNYGTISYNFQNKEMHKGTSIEKASFEVFRTYISQTIN